MNRRTLLLGIIAATARAQKPVEWVCPMDPDVRSGQPARCRKCGMALVAGIPEPVEYPVSLELQPRPLAPNAPVRMTFRITEPKSRKPAKLQLIHEKLFHLFLVSEDLQFFAHEHPQLKGDGSFVFNARLPKSGEYRVLCDFYPENATPQLIGKSIIVPGPHSKAHLQPTLQPQMGENVRVSLRSEPARPVAGKKTMLFFELDPASGLQPYLGAWGHMLAASSDLVDMIHAHPAWEEAGPSIQFNLIFPRPGLHRVWVQFQREDVVNTVAFNVPVAAI